MNTEILDAEMNIEKWLREAVQLATDNVAAGGGPFGALIVRRDEIIVTGTNQVTTLLDPTAHAEITAIRAACQVLGDFKLTECVLISSCEPCPLCLSAALWARIDSIYYAADRDDAASVGFDDRDFYELFSQPQANWPVSIAQVKLVNSRSPFAAWQDKSDKRDY